MQTTKLLILITVFSFLFYSCEKENEKESPKITLKANLMNAKRWNATKFIVNGENTMPPDSSSILDRPVPSASYCFNTDSLTFQMELYYEGGNDISGPLKMAYSINSVDSTITIIDKNWWTESASFTGKHKVVSLNNDDLIISGPLGTKLTYKMILKREK